MARKRDRNWNLSDTLSQLHGKFAIRRMSCTWTFQGVYDYVDCGRLTSWDNDEVVVLEENLWDHNMSVQFIEDRIIGIPGRPLYLIHKKKGEHHYIWEVADLHAHNAVVSINEYMDDHLPLNGVRFLEEHNGKTFRQLNEKERERIQYATVEVCILDPQKDISKDELDYYIERSYH